MRTYAPEDVARQPTGYWSTEASKRVLAGIRGALAVEALTQPHWWTLNHVSGAPGTWNRTTLTTKLSRFADFMPTGTFDDVYDDLIARGWLVENGTFALTDAGRLALDRARDRNAEVHTKMLQNIDPADFVTMINVLRQVIENLEGDSDLPT
ncbi:MarR family transcriptional regulator [Actinocorallia longicatena]|uniref:MarR family transcriptional regulator n=1 Tax=Actinocorallia longicatena TaxID=111803 RepID=A0ABP6QCA0_9ACTN